MGSHCCPSDVDAVAVSCVGLSHCGAEDLLVFVGAALPLLKKSDGRC